MALQGTLDTFALPDVLRLLATTGKTGQLLVQGDQGNGSLFVVDGAVVGGETSLASATGADEVLFELLRLDDGSFMFDQDATSDVAGEPVDVETVIGNAESAHAEWVELSAVVPSLDVGLRLADELDDDQTTLDRDRWRLIVAIGSGSTVRAVGDRLDLGELPVLRAVRDLVDDGLATIGSDVAADGFEAPDQVGSTVSPGSFDDLSPVDDPDAFDDGFDDPGSAGPLPTLDDDVDVGELFEEDTTGDELPEPLLAGTEHHSVEATGRPEVLRPEEAALLEGQIDLLPADQRELVERAADASDAEAADALLDELPPGVIDRDLMRRFLATVRS